MIATDPVCGMTIYGPKAAASETWEGQTFLFCSAQCHRTFRSDPARYAERTNAGSPAAGNAIPRGDKS